MAPVALMSAVMNNTPVVAMYLPIVNDWARKLRISPSKLLLPLSYASILGGKITYIGTASNVVVMSLYIVYVREHATEMATMGVTEPGPVLKFWGVAWLGVPTAIVGIAYLLLASRWLLPARRQADQVALDARRYEVEMIVQPDSPIVGSTIEEAGLRQLPGLFLTQIERDDDVLAAVAPEEVVRAHDRLAFVGILESVVDLRKIRGLAPATDQVDKIQAAKAARRLVEAVVSHNSALVGKNVRETRFRTTFNAAIIAVHRNGQHINMKIGDIVLQPGDTLLLETHPGFVQAHRNSSEFYLVSAVEGFRPMRHERAGVALVILGLLVGLFTLTGVNQVVAAFLCAMLMIITRCVTGTVARAAINWQVLVVIGAALGFGEALIGTGAAAQIAHGIIQFSASLGLGPQGLLFAVFIVAALFAQVINTNGAAVMMFPIAMATVAELGVRPEAFVFVLMIAAGSSFISPVSYQTNLMVYGPGGYRFNDFVRIGTPLTLLIGLVTALIAPLVFPLAPGG
jgi:di/tricarboxylate transporter